MRIIANILLSFALFFCLVANTHAEEVEVIEIIDLLNILEDNRGKVIVVNFFATWCPPCVDEIPDIIKIREEYSEDELYIIGISLDDDMQALEEFVAEQDFNYPIYRDDIYFSLSDGYRVDSIPHNIIYDSSFNTRHNEAGILTYNELKSIIDAGL